VGGGPRDEALSRGERNVAETTIKRKAYKGKGLCYGGVKGSSERGGVLRRGKGEKTSTHLAQRLYPKQGESLKRDSLASGGGQPVAES